MKKIVLITLYLFACISSGQAKLQDHLKKIENKTSGHELRNIDYIYLINLDQRVERLENCLRQLAPYGIVPFRFSAVYGWKLSPDVLNDIGLKFSKGMSFCPGRDSWAICFKKDGSILEEPLTKSSYKKRFFSRWMSRGAIGCTLSHLSILQDAYNAGYKTIWILEDDFYVQQDPRILSDIIDTLDQTVGSSEWDVLYTDHDYCCYFCDERNRELPKDYPYIWRPDVKDYSRISEYKRIGDEFAKIGSRIRTHSMIIRRSGMKKILDFEKNRGLFLPYDHELPYVPDLKLYILRNPVVTGTDITSDTKNYNFMRN